MRWIRRLLGLLAAIVAIVLVALLLLPTEKIASLVETRFERATGRALTIDGGVRPGFWPEIGIRTGPVTIANADWAGSEPMIEAEALSVGIAWAGLFGGDIRVTGVDLIRPVIRLESAPDGRGNWTLLETSEAPPSAAHAAPTGDTSTRTFALDRATITDGTVIYRSPDAEPVTLSAIDATLTLPDFSGEAELSIEAEANGEPLSADLGISQFAAFLSDGAVPLTLEAALGGGTIAFDGRAGLQPLAAEGKVSASLDGLGPLTRATGAAPTTLPEGLGRDRLGFEGTVALAGDTLSARDAALTLDDNHITGEFDLALAGARPRLTGRFDAGDLDLSRLEGEEEPGDRGSTISKAKGEKSGQGWSTDPIDVSGLRAIDAEVTVEASRVALSSSELGKTRLHVALDDGRLVTTIREMSAYDGTVAGQVVLNGRKGLSASADLSGSAIAISRLFAELLDFDRLVALGDMEIAVLTSGKSMNALMNGMNGEGKFTLGAGELLGLDLVGMIRNLDPGFVGEGSATIFDKITGTFRIVDGVVINENMKLLGPLLTAKGSGEVALGDQTLDYRILPTLLTSEGEEISVPVLITGPWNAPKIRLDLDSVVKAKADAEIERAQNRAEKEAKKKALEELDAAPDDDLEEVAKDKLEKELKRGLKRLFD